MNGSIFDPPLVVLILTALPMSPIIIGAGVGLLVTVIKRMLRELRT